MCYLLLLSTSSDQDLALLSNDLVTFSQELPDVAAVDSLRYSCQWYVGSQSGCSCTFRHLHSVELGFGVPVDWYPEESEEIRATLQFITIVRSMVERGDSVDCIDLWEGQGDKPLLCTEVVVDLAQVDNEAFRFFENHHFIFAYAI